MKELEKVAKNKYGEGYELVCVLQEAMYWKTFYWKRLKQ
jgi:hypothetical protein